MSPPAASLPARCPSCSGALHVVALRCAACGTEVHGSFAPCPVCALAPQAQALFGLFLSARGNLKGVQRALGVSYPTARQRIEGLFRQLESAAGELEAAARGATAPAATAAAAPAPAHVPVDRGEVLARLERGEIDVATAERLLRG